MPKDSRIYAELGVMWKADRDKQHLASGRLSGEATVFLGLPPNAGLLLYRNDKGDNEHRPDYRLLVVVDTGAGGDRDAGGDGFDDDSGDDPFGDE